MTTFYPVNNCCCIIIDPGENISYPTKTLLGRSSIHTASEFIIKTKRDLDVITSKPIGRELLNLISKRNKGVGTSLGKTVTINCGMPTISPRTGVQLTKSQTHASAITVHSKFMKAKKVTDVAMLFPGIGSSANVYYDPTLNYDAVLGIRTPSYIALAHELIHAFHFLSGSLIHDMSPLPSDYKRFHVRFPLIEEAKTVGAGAYENTRISENTIRKEHNLVLRKYYSSAGDCGSAFLGNHGQAN